MKIILSPKYISRRIYDALHWRWNLFFPPSLKQFVHILPTLRCNLECPYCTNFLEGGKPLSRFDEIPVEDWIAIIKKVNKNVILTGGEPTLYKGIADLLNAIPEKLSVQLYSNLTFNPNLLLHELKRRIFIYGSCHQSGFSAKTIREHVDALSKSPYILGSVHFIRTTENASYADEMETIFRDSPWKITITPDKREISKKVLMKEHRKVRCLQKVYLIGPDGKQYPCSTRMFQQQHALANLRTESFIDKFIAVECDNWGSCACCDGQTQSETEFLEDGQ